MQMSDVKLEDDWTYDTFFVWDHKGLSQESLSTSYFVTPDPLKLAREQQILEKKLVPFP